MEVKGKKVLVFGLGISGIGAGQILERHGAEVIMYDGNQKLTEEKIKKQLGEDSSAKIVIGDFPEEVLEKLDMKSSLHISSVKVMSLQLPVQMVKQPQRHFWERL